MGVHGHLVSWPTGHLASLVQALGTNPLTLGSSGTFSKYLSNFAFKSSTPQFVVFLTYAGSELNNWGPFI